MNNRLMPPKHIAIIMDGNRRWAKAHGLPSLEGHRRAVKNVDKINPETIVGKSATLSWYIPQIKIKIGKIRFTSFCVDERLFKKLTCRRDNSIRMT